MLGTYLLIAGEQGRACSKDMGAGSLLEEFEQVLEVFEAGRDCIFYKTKKSNKHEKYKM